jgi:hypothetical protein
MGDSTSGQAQVAAEAQQLKNGDMVIQLDPENMQVVIGYLEKKDVNPIVFDLKKGLIYNAAFPVAAAPEPAPP